MNKTLDLLSERTESNRIRSDTDYRDEKGILWCGICGEKKENDYTFMGREKRLPCLCKCERDLQKQRAREDEIREFSLRVQQLKSVGLTESRFREWRFENDNGSTPKLELARKYVENWEEMQANNIGYVLMGPVGTGKSFFAGCIANALMEKGTPVMMTNFSGILNELTGYRADKNEIISRLVSFPLLIIDDLGIERDSAFSLEMIFNVIDRRYCKKMPLIVTTNLSYQDMTRPDLDITHQRIYSRLMEMCLPVVYEGKDQRSSMQERKIAWMNLRKGGG